MTIGELKKVLRIKREVCTERDDTYYIVGTESALRQTEKKLLSCEYVYEVQREFFTQGPGRISFKILADCPVCHKTPELIAHPCVSYAIRCRTDGCPMNCTLNTDVYASSPSLNMAEYPIWLKSPYHINQLGRDWARIVRRVEKIMSETKN